MTDVTLGYAYGNGRLSAMTRTMNGLGQTYNMAYDGFGKLTAVQVGTRSLAGYTYAANDGLLTQMTYGNGNTVAYDYDDLERVKNIYYNNSSSPAYTYTYKGEGTLGQLTDNSNNRTYAYTYDSLGRLNGLTEQFGGVSVQTFSASYDTANRPTNVTYAVSPSWNGTLGSNRVYTYTYSASDGSLTSMTGPGASMAYTYDALKRLMKRVVSSDSSEVITRNYGYLAGSGSNTSPLVSSLTANHGSTILFSGNYSYDSVGNITAITGSAPASYTYDSQNQLLTEVRDGTTYTYTYDAAGNMLSKTTIGGSGTDTFTYGNAEWRDLLTAYNGNAITYDTVGNPTTWYDGATMTWVNGRRLASISATNSHSALAFTYDVDGLRLTKTVGTGSSAVEHKYTWQGGKLVSENYGTTTLEFFYDESGAPYALSYNGTIYYYVTNLQGDVVKIVNASGTSQAEYSYNAWGQVISATGTLAAVNPIRYRGYYYDVETGFYYLKSRYYDPEICRFINADSFASTGQGFVGCDMFAFCRNNPANLIDENGKYSRKAAVDYAKKWYNDSNPDYYYYIRGDCANFVSQCLNAGKVEMTDKWYSIKTPKTTYSLIDKIKSLFHPKYRYDWDIGDEWRLANEQYLYFSNPDNGYINGDVITITSADGISEISANGGVQPGDLLYFSRNGTTAHHATIITKVDGSMIYYAGHTSPAFDKPLSSGIGSETVFIIRVNNDA